MTIHRVIKNN